MGAILFQTTAYPRPTTTKGVLCFCFFIVILGRGLACFYHGERRSEWEEGFCLERTYRIRSLMMYLMGRYDYTVFEPQETENKQMLKIAAS
ncbi:hypothetical protein QBC44DRAFT_101393 [Cladorrhinum sp. PSN332]|nr:hypothetical protein QBC44DRAFT_101393 [Cladorrhinum sp. PSN332]